MNINHDIDFWFDQCNSQSKVYEIYNDVFEDDRGAFSEIWKQDIFLNEYSWLFGKNFIKQINNSFSKENVIRGCHAQSGKSCQAKLVYATGHDIYDIITDCRPQSDTFGMSKLYILSHTKCNKLFVPRGFLHGIYVPNQHKSEFAVLTYLCDNIYDKSAEVSVNPLSIIPQELERNGLKTTDDFIISDKDKSGLDFNLFLDEAIEMYKNGRLWYEQ
jgi:dTDP-4-dehydrorhamnose 3,5-epimerase